MVHFMKLEQTYWYNTSIDQSLYIQLLKCTWCSLRLGSPILFITFSTSVQLQTKLKTTHIIANYFLQLLTNNVDKYKLRMKLQSKVYATCQHHNNIHYMPLLANLIKNYSTNIVKGCCQLHSINGWTSSVN